MVAPPQKSHATQTVWAFSAAAIMLGPLSLYSQELSFPRPDTGYAITGNKILLKTVNAGATWDTLPPAASPWFIAVQFPHPDTGYVMTQVSVLRTRDGGATWTESELPGLDSASRHAFALSAPHVDTAYVAGGGPYLARSVDGSTTWDTVDVSADPSLGSPSAISFLTGNTGFAVGYTGIGGYIARTTDGGATWEHDPTWESTPFVNRNFTWIAFPHPDTGYVAAEYAGSGGGVLKTTDGGDSWDYHGQGLPASVYQIEFPNPRTGYARCSPPPSTVGRGPLYKTTDGGATWSVASADSIGFDHVVFTTPDTGHGVRDEGVWKTVDGGATWIPSPTTGILGEPRGRGAVEIGDFQAVLKEGRLEFTLGQASHVRATIVDLRGQSVLQITDEKFPTGTHVVGLSSQLPWGLYSLVFSVNGDKYTSRFVYRR